MKRAALFLALLTTASPALAQHAVRLPRSLHALPALDASVAPDFTAAIALVDTALRMRPPHVMDRTPQQDLSRKISQTLAPWLRNRMTATDAAEHALQALSPRSPLHTAIAAALDATLWQSFATDITSLAPPRQIQADPQMLAMYHQLLDQQTAPFRERAHAAFESCTRNAPPGAWATYCSSQ